MQEILKKILIFTTLLPPIGAGVPDIIMNYDSSKLRIEQMKNRRGVFFENAHICENGPALKL